MGQGRAGPALLYGKGQTPSAGGAGDQEKSMLRCWMAKEAAASQDPRSRASLLYDTCSYSFTTRTFALHQLCRCSLNIKQQDTFKTKNHHMQRILIPSSASVPVITFLFFPPSSQPNCSLIHLSSLGTAHTSSQKIIFNIHLGCC